jgi:hypothetical protein
MAGDDLEWSATAASPPARNQQGFIGRWNAISKHHFISSTGFRPAAFS